MAEWKINGRFPESMFAINFREQYPAIAEQMLKDGKWDFDKQPTVDGYRYKAKEVTAKKDGKKYTFVERVKVGTLGEESPENRAAEITREEYQNGAKKGHEENIAMHKEQMAAIQKQTTVMENLNETMLTVLAELRKREDHD